MSRWIFAMLTCVLLALPGSALAQQPSAAAKFTQGQERYDAEDYAAALALFREAHQLSQSPNAHLYVARALRELGRLAEAYDEMQQVVREATAAAEQDAKYAPTRDSAAAELAILEPKVAKVVVAMAESPPGTTVAINGSELPAERIGTPVAVAPGPVKIVATPPEGEPKSVDLTLAGGETKTVPIAFSASAAKRTDGEPAAAPVAAPTPDEPETEGGELRVVGFVLAGVGVAGMGMFAVTGLMAQSKLDELETDCGAQRCPPERQDDVDQGRTLQTLANVGLGVGIGGIVIGSALIIFGGPSEVEQSAAFAPSIEAGPDGAALRFRGSF
jgi:hypothetical protein